MNCQALSPGPTQGCPYIAVGMHRALDSAIGLPSRSTRASRMLAFVTPPDVRRSFMVPPESQSDGRVLRRNPVAGARLFGVESIQKSPDGRLMRARRAATMERPLRRRSDDDATDAVPDRRLARHRKDHGGAAHRGRGEGAASHEGRV